MSESPTWLIKRCAEFVPVCDVRRVPRNTRGVYALLKRRPHLNKFDVVYIGMAKRGIRGRLEAHTKGKKSAEWTHFSVYEVHDNVRPEQIAEIEGLLRHIYQYDTRANRFNVQKQHRPLRQVRLKLELWTE